MSKFKNSGSWEKISEKNSLIFKGAIFPFAEVNFTSQIYFWNAGNVSYPTMLFLFVMDMYFEISFWHGHFMLWMACSCIRVFCTCFLV
jgi:hypothetical protein